MSNTFDVASEETSPLIFVETDVTLHAADVSIPVGTFKDVSQEEDVTMEDPPLPQLISYPTDLVKAYRNMTLDAAVQVSVPR